MRMPVYVTSNNTVIRKQGDYLLIDKKGSAKIPCPSEGVSYIIKWGNSKISEQVLNFLADKKVPVFRFSYGGKYCGIFLPPEHNIGKSRLNQYNTYFDKEKRLFLAKEFVKTASLNKIKVLRKYYYKNKYEQLKKSVDKIKVLIKKVEKAKDVECLRGFEANIAKQYFGGLRKCFKFFKFGKRVYHPPKDEVNCLLSFGYALLYSEVLSKVFEHGLCPFLGFLHEQNGVQEPLVYDVAEVFKQKIDLFVLDLINSGFVKDGFFNKKVDGACLLNTYGKNFVLKKWIAFLRRTSFDKVTDDRISFVEVVRKEVVKLKHFLDDGVVYEGVCL